MYTMCTWDEMKKNIPMNAGPQMASERVISKRVY
jgi:hypothetical protein